ncbi:MAG: hypothetical protein ACJA1F_001072 [Paracoccaceae bacterium]|jgi:hypothetical protein
MNTFTKTTSVAALVAIVGTGAVAGTFNVDGQYNPNTDAYSHEFFVPSEMEDGTAIDDVVIKVGLGNEVNPGVGVFSSLFVFVQLPTNFTDLTFGTGTHDSWQSANKYPIGFDKVTGSESASFTFNGEDGKIKLSYEELKEGKGKSAVVVGTAGHKIDKDANGQLVAAATSLDYNMVLFPSLFALGDDSSSPTLKKDDGFGDLYEVALSNFDGYVFTQNYEFEIAGSFTLDDLPILFTSDQFFGDGNENKDNNFFQFHASPSKGGSNSDAISQLQGEDLTMVAISNGGGGGGGPLPATVPVPLGLPMLLTGLGVLGFMVRRKKSA